MSHYFVRLGCLGDIYIARSSAEHSRGRRVIVRTSRGVELAEVVGPQADSRVGQHDTNEKPEGHLRILRATTAEDELLIRRLDRHKRDAVESCRDLLAKSGATTTLLDVDLVFDGGTLLMHFLGPVDETVADIESQVAQRYASVIGTERFAKLLDEGCGPDCGTSAGGGCGGCGGSCSGCAVASACKTTG
jgi:hypothetical protein